MTSRRLPTSRAQSSLQPRKPLPVRSVSQLGRNSPTRPPNPQSISKMNVSELHERFQIPTATKSKSRKHKLSEAERQTLDLREEKALALDRDNLDLDRADAIQRILDLNQTNTTQKVLEEHSNWLQETVDDAVHEMETQMNEITNEMDEIEFEYRAEVDELFVAMQNDHLDDLTNLEFLRSVELLKEDNRMTVDELLLRKAAECEGKAGRMPQARIFKEEAEKRRAVDNSALRQRIDEKFDAEKKRKMERFVWAFEKLQQSFRDHLDEKDRLRDERLEDVRQRTKVFVKSQLQKAILAVLDQLRGKVVRKEVQNHFTEFVRGKLQEKEIEFLLE